MDGQVYEGLGNYPSESESWFSTGSLSSLLVLGAENDQHVMKITMIWAHQKITCREVGPDTRDGTNMRYKVSHKVATCHAYEGSEGTTNCAYGGGL